MVEHTDPKSKKEEKIKRLKKELDEKDKRISQLEDTVDSLRKENKRLSDELSMLKSNNSALHEEKIIMCDEIKELKRKTNMDSSNSSKPPSTDGYKNVVKSQREKTDRKQGGQPGHIGHGIVVDAQVPDEIVDHYPPKCQSCPKFAECKSRNVFSIGERHTVVEAVVKKIIVRHRVMKAQCPNSELGIDNSGSFPDYASANMQYGNSFKILACLLNTYGAVSIGRTKTLFHNLFNVSISQGTIKSMITECSDVIFPAMKKIRDKILGSDVCHFDETGISINGILYWLHDASTLGCTYQTISKKRGYEGIVENGILPLYKGIIVHDCFSPYWLFENLKHGVCNAHIMRELKSNKENEPEHRWSKKLLDLLKDMLSSKKASQRDGKDALEQELIADYDRQYDEIMSIANIECPDPPDSTPHKKGKKKKGIERSLIERLCRLKDCVTLFYHDFRVPFDNNLAERDQRNVKTKMKVSGCFRTLEGAKEYLTIRSYLSTAAKHGINPVEALNRAFADDFKFLE